MTNDPLLERLRRLPGPRLDDVTSARTLARAEAAFSAAPAARRWLVPAALAAWALLYAWGALREIGRLFPATARAGRPAVAALVDPGRR